MAVLRVAALISFFICVCWIVETPAVHSYVRSVKKNEWIPAFFPTDGEEELLRRVEKEAPRMNRPPVDARVDRVWHAIPGLNGRVVDVEATVRSTLKQKSQTRIIWVYREIPPKVSLDHLGAEPIYRGNGEKQMAALMVNVSWGTEHIPGMLEVLRRENVHATFFLDGSWLKKNPDLARRIVREGHEIGNHAWSHPLMSQISREQMNREIGMTEELIRETLKVRSRWFAPPAGDYNRQVAEVALSHRMRTVLWTLDTVDWRKTVTPQMMVNKISGEIGPGHLVLTHPTDRTVLALPEILRAGKRKGLKWGTVSEVLSSKRADAN
jgi:probable sporulation protein (polysaccharide deacetylase family)